jgi:prevent-host-death family protein
MNATAKDLRTHAKKLLEAVDRGEEVVITHRGKPRARLVPLATTPIQEGEAPALFGLWHDHEAVSDVGAYVRRLRQSRV